jgi:hypothetical protein
MSGMRVAVGRVFRPGVRALIPEPKSTRLVFVGLAIFYAVLGLAVLTPAAVYSGDVGVKFVQARALAAHHFSSLDISYPGAFLDPDRRFFALRPPFVMAVGPETQAIFPTASAMLQAAAVTLGGIQGMVAVTLLAGLAVMYATAKMAEPALRPLVLLAIGVASPLWFYAISGMEHAPAVAFGAAAFACAMRLGEPKGAVLAGALLGLGAIQRDEVLLLTPGLLIVLWLRTRTWQPIVRSMLAIAAVVMVAACVDIGWFDRPPAAHLRHAVHLLQGSWMASEPGTDLPSLKPFTQRERYQTVIQYWLLGYGNDVVIALYAGGLAAALLLWRVRRTSIGLLVWLTAVVALAAIDVHEVVTAPKWLAGMQRVSPYFVLALMPGPANVEGPGWLRRAVLLTALAYVALAYAGVDTTGGKSLGPRLLLPLFPMLTVASLASIRHYLGAPVRMDRWVGYLGVLLVTMTAVIHVCGTVPAYIARNRDDGSAMSAVASAPERIIVADDMFTAQLLMPLYFRKIILLADTPPLASQLGAKMEEQRIAGVMLVSRGDRASVALAPLRLANGERRGRFVIQHWTR